MTPSIEQFSPHLESTFTLRDGDGLEREAVLVEAKTTGIETPGNRETLPFTLLFRVQVDAQDAHQGIYSLSGNSLENLQLFLVPVEADSDGVYFEAIFN